MSAAADLAREDFVSLTTYRRTGEPVATPLWIAADGEALLFWTPVATGKVKRLRRDGRVEMAPCSRMGKVADDAPRTQGHATLSDDPADLAATEAALARKYGLQYRVVTGLERLVATLRRRSTARMVVRVVVD